MCLVVVIVLVLVLVVVLVVVVHVVVVAGGGDLQRPVVLADPVDGGARGIQIVTSLILPVPNNLFVEQT